MNLLILLAALTLQDKPFPDADPKPAIEAAKKKATAENRCVLVLVGANDHEASHAAVKLIKKDKEVAKLVLYEYDLVLADVRQTDQTDGGGAQMLLPPYLVIMNAEGKVLSRSVAPTDSGAMVDLLKKHQAIPWNSKDVLAAAMKKAEKEKKRVLLTFGAPW